MHWLVKRTFWLEIRKTNALIESAYSFDSFIPFPGGEEGGETRELNLAGLPPSDLGREVPIPAQKL